MSTVASALSVGGIRTSGTPVRTQNGKARTNALSSIFKSSIPKNLWSGYPSEDTTFILIYDHINSNI